VAFDQIVNNAAKMYQMSAGQFSVPIVFRGPNASARQVGSQHSHAVEPFYCNVPGLHVVYPSTPRDAQGLLKTAFRGSNPVVFLEGETLYGAKGLVPEVAEDETIPFGKARIAREGKVATVVVWGRPTPAVLEVADKFAREGIELEVIDPRTLRPLDTDSIVESVKKTHRCVVVHEAPLTCGFGAEISARIMERCFLHLEAPVQRVAGFDTIMPYYKLELDYMPDAARISRAIDDVMAY
jgi:pyruvate dehydrogenase E1 component beta subunit